MQPHETDGVFYFPLRVYYEDTDAGGVVYHANYLNFCERARTEWLRHVTGGRQRLHREDGILFVVRRVSVDYRRPAKLDDLLTIETRLASIRKVRMTMQQTILRDGEVLAIADIELVTIRADFTPTPVPQTLLSHVRVTPLRAHP